MVEDEPALRDLVTTILEDEGLAVEAATCTFCSVQ
jgi:DNA-binding response OmpR family regulator